VATIIEYVVLQKYNFLILNMIDQTNYNRYKEYNLIVFCHPYPCISIISCTMHNYIRFKRRLLQEVTNKKRDRGRGEHIMRFFNQSPKGYCFPSLCFPHKNSISKEGLKFNSTGSTEEKTSLLIFVYNVLFL